MLEKRLFCVPGMPEVWRAMLLLVCVCTWLTAQTQGALVISHKDALTEDIRDTMEPRSIKKRSTSSVVEVYSVTVHCTVKSRFAHTVMTSKALNKANTSQEIFFEVELPKTAFITNFSMEIGGQVYVGEVKEKEKAKKQYETAVSSGQTAGLVKASGRKMEKFSVSVNIAAESTVTFVLTYEELLVRSHGKYEILTRVEPKERVQEFKIVTDIYEPQGISFVDAHASFLSNELLPLVEKTVTDKKAHISFSPTMEQQRSCSDCDGTLINGDFIIEYDVNQANNIGDIQIVNGYFVHFFAPPDLPRVPKNVVFVIDRSGSMSGRKIVQTREALVAILQDLPEEDHFSIVVFGSLVETWRDSLKRATVDNVKKAVDYAKKIQIQGSTNMNDALVKAVGMLVNDRQEKRIPERSIDMVILLTDGMPDGGRSTLGSIMKNVRNAGGGKTTLYCLGFGNNVDYSFLDEMGRQNKGLARRIYEGSDATLQLQGFYQEVSSPLLLDVDLRYPDNTVDFLTTNHFNQLFNGSEIVVAGRLTDNNLDNFLVEVFGQGFAEDYRVQGQAGATDWGVLYPDEEYIFGDFTERLWAYLTIQQLLEKSKSGTADEKGNATAKALDMSLQYSFVTPLTSMVVTKPETEDGPQGPLIADKLTEEQRQKAERHGGHSAKRAGLSKPASKSGGQSDVDGDPHFMIELPDRKDALCFNINDKPGTIFNLVRDPKPGFFVNGQIIGKKFAPGGAINTYFGRFGVIHQKLGVRLEVSTQDITVFHDGKQVRLLWSDTASIKETDMDLKLTKNSSLTVTLRRSVKFMVIRHNKVWKKRHIQQDYLGFYTLDSHRMSASVHGLLGQFYHGVEFEVSDIHSMKHLENVHATMYVKGNTLNVTRHWQKDFSRDLKNGESIPCWFVDRNGTGLIDGEAPDYIVSGLFKTTW